MPCVTEDELGLSFSVLNWTRKYTDGLRELIEKKLIEKLRAEGRRQATIADVQDCVASAFREYSEQSKCTPDLATVQHAMSDLENGRYRTVDQIINELQCANS